MTVLPAGPELTWRPQPIVVFRLFDDVHLHSSRNTERALGIHRVFPVRCIFFLPIIASRFFLPFHCALFFRELHVTWPYVSWPVCTHPRLNAVTYNHAAGVCARCVMDGFPIEFVCGHYVFGEGKYRRRTRGDVM